MARYHLTDQGPMKCSAQIQCPLQKKAIENGEDPNQIFHYDNKESATSAWGDKLAQQYIEEVHQTLKNRAQREERNKALEESNYDISENVKIKSVELEEVEEIARQNGLLTGTVVSGHIDPKLLNKNSYRVFGFRTWTDEMAQELLAPENQPNAQTGFQSTPLSRKEMSTLDKIQRNALKNFTGDDYQRINAILYNPHIYDDANADDAKAEYVKQHLFEDDDNFDDGFVVPNYKQMDNAMFSRVTEIMDSALTQTSGNQRIVFRGAKHDVDNNWEKGSFEDWVADNRGIGTILSYSGYTSSTYDFRNALERYSYPSKNFKKRVDESVLYEILTAEGVTVTNVSYYRNEQEVLLPREQRYVVVGRQHCFVENNAGRSGLNVIQMVAVDEDNNILDGTNSVSPKPWKE